VVLGIKPVCVVATATGALTWHEGIIRLAPAPYLADLTRADAHITNPLWHDRHPGLLVLADPLVEDVGKVRDGERGAASPAGWGAGEAGVFRSQAANPPLDFPACLCSLWTIDLMTGLAPSGFVPLPNG
jgi:hypothetical protein